MCECVKGTFFGLIYVVCRVDDCDVMVRSPTSPVLNARIVPIWRTKCSYIGLPYIRRALGEVSKIEKALQYHDLGGEYEETQISTLRLLSGIV